MREYGQGMRGSKTFPGRSIDSGLEQVNSRAPEYHEFQKFSMLYAAPARVEDGLVCLSDGVSWNPIAAGVPRLVIFLSGAWVAI